MDTKRSIKLPNDLILECIDWGNKVVGRGLHPRSLALSVRGAENDAELWAEAKMAECIFAMAFGLDPRRALNWNGEAELDGIDVVVDGVTVDVKQTKPGNALLIWSYGKAGKLELKTNLHVLALVKCSLRRGYGAASSWITRNEFLKERIIATKDNAYRLNVGTQYMHESDIWEMDCFPLARGVIDGRIGGHA